MSETAALVVAVGAGLKAYLTSGSTRTYYLYDRGEPVVEMNSSGQITAVNVFANDGLVARKQSGSWIYYNFDQQGNVAQRTSSTGAILSSSVYDAYGVESTTGTPTDPFGYNARWGYYLDRATGLYLCQHRYFDSAQGRWLNRDPIGFNGGVDLCGYCEGAPIGNQDPEGLTVYFCWRPVHAGQIDSGYSHWFLSAPGCGTMGYGPVPPGLISTYPANSDNLPISRVHCRAIQNVKPWQVACLCHLARLLKEYASKSPKLTGFQRRWCS